MPDNRERGLTLRETSTLRFVRRYVDTTGQSSRTMMILQQKWVEDQSEMYHGRVRLLHEEWRDVPVEDET